MRDAGDIQFAPVAPEPPPETPDWLRRFGEWFQDLLEPLGRALGMSWPTLQYVLSGLGALLALLLDRVSRRRARAVVAERESVGGEGVAGEGVAGEC